MDNTVLCLENISYKYPASKSYAIDNLSIKIQSGEKIAVLGKNGMGKSTLLFISNGVLSAQNGEVFLNGRKITDKKSDLNFLRQNIGLVFQDPEMQFIAPTVAEEISFGPLNLRKSQEETRQIIEKIVIQLNIKHLLKKPLHSLSGGEKKIVSIASVLALNPNIILFDEPTAGLDYITSQRLVEVIDNLAQKSLGIVISTHDIDFAWQWAERTVIIKDGKIYADGKSEDILTDKNLMEKADLRRPYLVEIYDILQDKNKISDYPKNLDEFKKLSNSIKTIQMT